MVDVGGVRDREADETVGETRRVELGDRRHHVGHGLAVVRGEPPHDAEVQVDDLAPRDDEVAGMRVGMEEAVVYHLLGVVVHELGADLPKIVAGLLELLRLIDGNALHEVHHHHVTRAEGGKRSRTRDVRAVGVVTPELLERTSLHEKVRLLAKRLPQLVHDRFHVEELLVPHAAVHVLGERAHDRDVLRHGLLHVRTLHLDGNELARDELGLVHLRHRCRTQGLVVDGIEQLLEGLVVLVAKRLEHGLAVHGLHVGAKLGKLARKALGQDLGAHGEDLTSLDEGGSQLLEHLPQALRGEAMKDVVAAHDRDDLTHPRQTSPRGGDRAVRRRASAPEDPDRLVAVVACGGDALVPVVEQLLPRAGGALGVVGVLGHLRYSASVSSTSTLTASASMSAAILATLAA